MKHVCDNYGKKWGLKDVVYAKDLHQRVEPGGIMLSGECRECGALCYPERKKKMDALEAKLNVLEKKRNKIRNQLCRLDAHIEDLNGGIDDLVDELNNIRFEAK